MRKIKVVVLLSVCVFTMFFIEGCRKNNIVQVDSQTSLMNEIELYLQKLKIGTATKITNTIDSISKELNFATISKGFFLGKEVISIDFFVSKSTDNKSTIRKIIFFKNNNIIERATIVKISSSINNFNFLASKFYKVLAFQERSFSGDIELNNLTNKLIAIYGFDRGNLSYVKSLTSQPKRSTQESYRSIDGELVCTAWYLETTYYYSDGSRESTREFLYISCGSEAGVGESGGGGGGSEATIVNNPCNQLIL